MSTNEKQEQNHKLIIFGIDPAYETDYIIETLYNQHIGNVSRIICVPYINLGNGELYMCAYVDFHRWYNNRYVKGFLKMLKSPCPKEIDVHLYHYGNLGWPVRLIEDTNVVFNLGYTKINITHYNKNHYSNSNINPNDDDSDTMALVKTEFMAKQCAENVLDC